MTPAVMEGGFYLKDNFFLFGKLQSILCYRFSGHFSFNFRRQHFDSDDSGALSHSLKAISATTRRLVVGRRHSGQEERLFVLFATRHGRGFRRDGDRLRLRGGNANFNTSLGGV